MKLSLFKVLLFKNTKFLNKIVFIKEPSNIDFNKHYDIALVLGCSNHSLMFNRVDYALELYKKKVIDKLYLTGGIGSLSNNRKEIEALVMKDYMISKGVKEEDIITETNSKNTIENFKNTLKLIDNTYKRKIDIVLVTSSFHMKRSKSILENLCNHNIYTYAATNNICDIDKWMNNKTAKKYIKLEAISLYRCQKNGYIKNIEM